MAKGKVINRINTNMKRIILMSLLFSCMTINSQEKSKYKSAYESEILSDTINKESFMGDTYIIQIADNLTKGYYYKPFYSDSLENANKELYDQMSRQFIENLFKYSALGDPDPFSKAFGSLLPNGPTNLKTYKNYKTQEVNIIDRIILVGQFVFTDELKPQNWEIQTDTMTILGYHSQKATCHYRGRDWIAWFTSEIPISEGPWKFYGLPGLITKVADDKGHYSFTLTGFQEIEEPIDTDIPKKAEKTTREKFIKAWRQEEEGKYGANIVLEKGGVTARPSKNNSEKGRIRYDYIETDYKEWEKGK